MPHISEANNADIPQLCGLLGILFSQEAEFSPDEAKQARGLSMIIGHPDCGRIMVMREGNRVIGMVNLLFSVSTALGAKVAVLEDVVVMPEYRGKVIGSALLDAAIGCAKENDCERITLLTDSDNTRGQEFYGKFGFKQSKMQPMRLMLQSEK